MSRKSSIFPEDFEHLSLRNRDVIRTRVESEGYQTPGLPKTEQKRGTGSCHNSWKSSRQSRASEEKLWQLEAEEEDLKKLHELERAQEEEERRAELERQRKRAEIQRKMEDEECKAELERQRNRAEIQREKEMMQVRRRIRVTAWSLGSRREVSSAGSSNSCRTQAWVQSQRLHQEHAEGLPARMEERRGNPVILQKDEVLLRPQGGAIPKVKGRGDRDEKEQVHQQCNQGKSIMYIEDKDRSLLPKFISRNVLGKLRRFDGNPSDWPFFIEEFESSTRECGFSEAENLQRLKTALEGTAREAVKPMLGLPGSLDKVMDKLRKLFGRPDLTVKKVIESLDGVSGMQTDDMQAFSRIISTVGNVVATIKLLNREQYFMNPVLLDKLVEKLSPSLRLQWGEYAVGLGIESVTLEHFDTWLQKKEDAVIFTNPTLDFTSALTPCKNSPGTPDLPRGGGKSEGGSSSERKMNKVAKCLFCANQNHDLESCGEFERDDLEKRREWAAANRVCFKCLGRNHQAFLCRSKTACKICRGRHHHLFHLPDELSRPVASHMHSELGCTSVLFKMVPIVLRGPAGEKRCFAFLDDGASVTMLEEETAKELGLKGVEQPLSLQWSHDATREEPRSQLVALGVRGGFQNAREFNVDARTVSKLSLPMQTVDVEAMKSQWKHLNNPKEQIELSSYANARPVMLIGQDCARLIVSSRVCFGPWHAPILSRTELGWVVHGKVAGREVRKQSKGVQHPVMERVNMTKAQHLVQSILSDEPTMKDGGEAPNVDLNTDNRYSCKKSHRSRTRETRKARQRSINWFSSVSREAVFSSGEEDPTDEIGPRYDCQVELVKMFKDGNNNEGEDQRRECKDERKEIGEEGEEFGKDQGMKVNPFETSGAVRKNSLV